MTGVQCNITHINNQLTRLATKTTAIDNELRSIDTFARHSISSLQLKVRFLRQDTTTELITERDLQHSDIDMTNTEDIQKVIKEHM